MKKVMNIYITMLIGVLVTMLSLSSCTDQDDINIVYHHNATIEINTVNMYQSTEVDVAKFQNVINSLIYKPCISLLIYNPDGSLNRKAEIIADDLRPVKYELKDIDQQEYTIICLQYFINVSNDTNTCIWKIEDEENLDKVHITVESASVAIPWYECIGIDTQKVIIYRDSNISLSPQVAGCFVDLQYENLDASEYQIVGLFLRNRATGMYLSPKYIGNDKYYYVDDVEGEHWGNVAAFLSNENLKTADMATYFILELGKVNCCIGLSDIININKGKFWPYPSNSFYFNFENGGLYKSFCYYHGGHKEIITYFGKRSDFSDWYEKLEKWERFFDEPYTQWGKSVEDVKNYMTNAGYNIWFDIEQSSNGLFYIGYIGKFSENNIQYVFSKSTEDLVASILVVAEKELSPLRIADLFDNNPKYSKIKAYDECYQEYGCYVYVNDNTQVEITPNLKWDNGESYTQIGYYPRTYQEDVLGKKMQKTKKMNLNAHQFNLISNKLISQ